MTSQHVIFGISILLIYVNATPRNEGKFEQIVERQGPEFDSEIVTFSNQGRDDSLTREGRQKQLNEYNEFVFSSSRPSYSSYANRDQYPYARVSGSADPLTEIRRRLQEIADFLRQPPLPLLQSPIQYPHYNPSTSKPQIDCSRDIETKTTTQTPISDHTQTVPNLNTRDVFADMGFVDEIGTNDGEDFSRPISFDPVKPDEEMVRLPPPVEHGSNQAGINSDIPSTTVQAYPSNNVEQPDRPSVGASSSTPDNGPTKCDRVLLSCCHMLQVTYECFELQGCSNLTASENPCDTTVLLRIIDELQKNYG